MGDSGVLVHLRQWIGSCGFSVFLWSIRMTDKEYLEEVFQSEISRRHEQEGK